jgi:outer membrane protein OmpA-like peptidoglycan-associated protein/tetratricopeptide (TPR) repeat protein
MKQILLYTFLLTGSIAATAGSGGEENAAKALQYFKNAEKQFAGKRYAYAIPLYHSSLGFKGKTDSVALLHLAESYWQTKNYDSSLRFYQVFETRFGQQNPITQRMAELQATMGNYKAAVDLYQQLLAHNPVPGAPTELIKQRIKGFSNTALYLRDSIDTKIQFLKLNSPEQDFSPQLYENGLVFISNRFLRKTERGFGWDDLPFSQVYRVKDISKLEMVDTLSAYHFIQRKSTISRNHDYTQETSNDNNIIVMNNRRVKTTGTPVKVDKFSTDISARFNLGPLCFNKAGTKVYFTRNTQQSSGGKFSLEICEADLKNGSWTNIQVMPFVNVAYDYFHPALNSDETRLYFCSNKPGGEGGSDIYYVGLTDEYARKMAMPIDYKVNTAGNELFPTLKGDVLYFSSDGHPGLGGLDIYTSTAVNNHWNEPVNLGYPYNSAFDDFGIVFDNAGNKGFLSSNRLGSDDIFHFEYKPFRVKLTTKVLHKGTGMPLENARVWLRSGDGQELLDSAVTDIAANVTFSIRPGTPYTILANKPSFYPDSMQVQPVVAEPRVELQPIRLQPVPVAPVIDTTDTDQDGIPDREDKCPEVKGVQSTAGCPDIQARLNELAKMVFFKTASAELSPAALKPLNEVANIIKDYPMVTLDIEGHTDNRAGAAYNKDLSQRRANAVKQFFLKKGFDASRFTAAGYGLERPIATNATEEGRALNRRVALKANFK